MNSTKARLIELLSWRKPKDHFITICSTPEFLPHLKEISLSDDPNLNWRAAWILSNMDTPVVRKAFPNAEDLITVLSTSKMDGYRREILKIIVHLELNEDEEGALYEGALKMWEDLALSSSVRLYALRAMVRIAEVYPELKYEIQAYNDDHYFQGVSPGIANQIKGIFAALG